MEKYFANRHTVRNYTAAPVSEELVERIVEAAGKAPTCGTMQLYSVVETRDAEKKAQLAPLHFNQPCFVNAPVVLTVCADFHRFSRWCELSQADPGYDNFLSFMSAVADATILAQQIVTIAEMEGLGTCYLGTVTYNAPEIARVLELPDMVVPVACITLGWPADHGVETERIPVGGYLYRETYPRMSDEEVREVYRAKDDFAPNAQFIAENGKETLAQVYTDVRYPRAMNEEFSRKFLQYLRERWTGKSDSVAK